MTKKELIEALEHYNDDIEVRVPVYNQCNDIVMASINDVKVDTTGTISLFLKNY